MGVKYKKIDTMVMFVLHEDETDFFNFNIERKDFKKGEVIENDRLEGKYEVVHFDRVTVTVRPVTK